MPASTISYELKSKRSLASAIQKQMASEHLTVSALASRIGTGRTAVRRILDAKNTGITLRSIIRAANAVGLQIKLVTEPMSPKELGKLAARLEASKTPAEVRRNMNKITRGFYAGS